MILRFFLFLLIFFVVIRFVLRFLLPVFKITRMTHQKMNEMKKQMDHMQGNPGSGAKTRQKKQVEGDYIEFEEVK